MQQEQTGLIQHISAKLKLIRLINGILISTKLNQGKKEYFNFNPPFFLFFPFVLECYGGSFFERIAVMGCKKANGKCKTWNVQLDATLFSFDCLYYKEFN